MSTRGYSTLVTGSVTNLHKMHVVFLKIADIWKFVLTNRR